MNRLTPFDLHSGVTMGEVLEQMERGSFGARSLGRAWRVLREVLRDPDRRVLLTVSGAMSVAQCGGVFREMVRRNMLHGVVTTGAVITHQLIQELGYSQLQAPKEVNDAELVQARLNRIYDSLEPESNLEALEKFVGEVAGSIAGPLGSSRIVHHLARALPDRSGWLAECERRDIPVFVPALTDSELGLSLYSAGARRDCLFQFDPMADLDEFSEWISRRDRLAVITLGGGVPRNWAMQMIPYLKSRQWPRVPRLIAGIRICPDPAEYGHLSGSTYSEATTWGKLDVEDLGNFAEVCGDATIIFPFLISAAFAELEPPAGLEAAHPASP